MKINVDRMAVLAGLGNRRTLREGAGHDDDANEYAHEADEKDGPIDMSVELVEVDGDDADEGADHDDDKMVEIDEVMLVQELRRAKKIMMETKRREARKSLKENRLQRIIEEEVSNIFSELDLNQTGDWVYGNNKPKRSRKGYVHQGSYLKGLGFK